MEKNTACWLPISKRVGVLFIFLSLFLLSPGTGESSVKKESVVKPGNLQEVKKVGGVEGIRIQMEKGGEIYIELYPDDAPKTVFNFITQVQEGFYHGLTFHEVIPDSIVLGGEPGDDGIGYPGYTVEAELNKRKHISGAVAMARSQDPDSVGSPFYICLTPQPQRDGSYTVFGQVTEGMETVMAIQKGDRMERVLVDYSLPYILVTLVIRFVGVFLVLLVIMTGMIFMGYVTPRILAAIEKKKQGAQKASEVKKILQDAVDSDGEDLSLGGPDSPAAPEQEIAAAIGLALELEMGSRPISLLGLKKEEARGLTSSWVLQGRARQLQRKKTA